MKKAILVLGALAFACAAFAHEINFALTGAGDYSTNFTRSVTEPDSFDYVAQLPNGYHIDGVEFNLSDPEQAGKKSQVLCVGIDEYEDEWANELDTCVNDATSTADTLAKGFYSVATVLTNSFAKKDAIRSFIQNAAASLGPEDRFVYFHSSHGSDEPSYCLCTYEEEVFYTDEELAEDLSQFKDGVVIIVILDSCFSGGMVPGVDKSELFAESVRAKLMAKKAEKYRRLYGDMAPDLKEDALFLTACQYDEYSYTTYFGLSLFTLGLYSAANSSSSDLDYDGLISFYEIFERAAAWTWWTMPFQTPYISNENLAKKTYLKNVENPGANFGEIVQNKEKYRVFFNPKRDVDVTLSCAPDSAPKESYAFRADAMKCNLKVSNDDMDDNLTKMNLTFSFPTSSGLTLTDDLHLLLNYCDLFLEDHEIVKESKSGSNHAYYCYDQDMIEVGKAQVKVNSKKSAISFKIKIKGATELYHMVVVDAPVQDFLLTLRNENRIFTNASYEQRMSVKAKDKGSFTSAALKLLKK